MSIVGWLVLGLIAGFVSSKVGNRLGDDLAFDIALGVVGAVVAGYFFTLVGVTPVAGPDLYSMVVAAAGAIVVLVIYHSVVGQARLL